MKSSFAMAHIEKIHARHLTLPALSFLKAHPWQTAAAGFSGLMVGMLGWAVSLMVKQVIDHTHDLRLIYAAGLGTLAVLVLRGVMSLYRRWVQAQLARRVESRLAGDYLDHVTQIDLRCFEKYHTGDLLGRLRGIEVIRNALEERILGVTFDAALVVIAAIIMVRYSPVLAVLAALGASLPAVIIVALRTSIKRSFEEIRRHDADLNNQCMDALIGVRDLRVTEGEAWILDRMKKSYGRLQDFRIRHMMRLTLLGAVTIFLSTATGIGVLMFGARLINDGRLSQGELMFVFSMAGMMLGPLEQLASSWISFDEASVAYTRYREVLSLPAEPRERPPDARAIEGDLRLEDVGFGYRSGKRIVEGITLHMPAGSSLSIVGESGAGKSTLLSLMAGLYLPEQGRILLDGRDLREIGLERAREKIGCILQTPHLFDATVEENIRMGFWGATPEDVRRAAELAHADEFIRRLPEGYQTSVSRSGGSFSGGQVQRIAIARALVCDPRLLLLDEATANLDAHTEAALWKALSEGRRPCTRVFITHRLATTIQTDRIAVVDHGRIAEIGTFTELMNREGAFHRLWKRQMPVDPFPLQGPLEGDETRKAAG